MVTNDFFKKMHEQRSSSAFSQPPSAWRRRFVSWRLGLVGVPGVPGARLRGGRLKLEWLGQAGPAAPPAAR